MKASRHFGQHYAEMTSPNDRTAGSAPPSTSATSSAVPATLPACVMAMARLNRPSIFVYGGTIRPGAKRRDIVSVFEAVGARSSGKITDKELLEVEQTAIPGPGACGGMYTANTMASAIEAL